MKFLAYLVSGISLGSIYAIIALGYTMVYGIAKMLNFAHGDVIMVGGYISYIAASNLGLPPLISVLLAMAVCTVLGITIEALAYRPLRSAPKLAVLITAIGVSYFLQNSALLIFGANPKAYTPVVSGTLQLFDGQLSVSYVSLLTVACCIVIMVGLTLFTGRTRMGKAMRACSEDKGAAQLMGINVNRTISLTFAIGSALAAVAGALLCSFSPTLMPTTGSMPGIKAFTAAVFGGIGSIPARHQGLHRGRLRRHRLHPGGLPRRHPARRDRGAGQGLHLHAAQQLHRVRGADRHPAGASRRPARQAHAGKGLRRCAS